MRLLHLSLCLLLPTLLTAQSNPIELGHVKWLRSLTEAQKQSSQTGKPILILFQEVPGCATCRNYGTDVLTIPLLVEAIETEFVPLCIYNNKGGHDAEVLKQYNEPSWNNPVVRVVDQNGKDVVARLNGNYSAAGLSSIIRSALLKSKGSAPQYVHLLTDELSAASTASATFSMYCFWTGEALFGKLNGVVKTTAGFQNGKEVVVVEYNPSVITRAELDKIAMSQKCRVESTGTMSPDSTPKYYLSNSKYKNIPMLEIQKCRVNSALGEGQDPKVFLSPRQLAMAKT